jgi:3-deoxy-7-phosphoheptulonate synthase
MIAIMNPDCTLADKAAVVRLIESEGCRVIVSEQDGVARIGVIGPTEALILQLSDCPGVAEIRTDTAPYPMVSREGRPHSSRFKVRDVVVGGKDLIVIGGPCSVEGQSQIMTAAAGVRGHGAAMLRGGAFKPRTSPYSFQGMAEDGLKLLAEARERTGLPVVTEIVAPQDVDLVAKYADVLQVGARNMQNYRLLEAVGNQQTPVLLKRGMSATVDELLHAAEYIVSAGNPRVMLCERGIRTFGNHTRNTLDVGAIAVLKAKTHLPIIADPSHAAGLREFVPQLALAGIAAGADGLIVEVHPDPSQAVSDGRQSLTIEAFGQMMDQLRPVATALGRAIREGADEIPS